MTLCVDDLSIVKVWVGESYALQKDCKGHTGAMMSLCKVAGTSFSREKKPR